MAGVKGARVLNRVAVVQRSCDGSNAWISWGGGSRPLQGEAGACRRPSERSISTSVCGLDDACRREADHHVRIGKVDVAVEFRMTRDEWGDTTQSAQRSLRMCTAACWRRRGPASVHAGGG